MTMFNNKEIKEAEELSNSSNIIGKGTILRGGIETFGNIRVEGKVIGDIITKSKAAFGHSSYIEGNVLAQNAEIAGTVDGKVEVTEMLVLKPSAVINGDIVTNKLVIESGASFNGKCQMGVTVKEIKIGEKNSEERPLLKAQS
ncbi:MULTISPECIES: polymer-forming cytoskeletal protein [unclassified Imperialibacter]|jgi:cytoskeletal protein CcmA (bactofilin family)|uniref:bactofilin family protein n=1 Tax=unclassified Imperialibacter TaxID=2629706 RepID=UPI001256B750|nr:MULTISPECIES: polymer-forming cytoskeletal protein [unclassified Imperialibacter]CAD5271211.1 Cell shape determination protein CcmA [Imperialibacter sp. 89]CAD5298680.1 Cell shape determination protein CcmA [Imperialibacter sp. 75]VVT35007.1 Cell shape determination protein CcmA [Imperialibacter sp. EC-SDR9]|tara:strand:- start:15140 stop:15568 length:429 start_codon:yes stop_codon:yes gene_type:complete